MALEVKSVSFDEKKNKKSFTQHFGLFSVSFGQWIWTNYFGKLYLCAV